jgi:hypothetical protein
MRVRALSPMGDYVFGQSQANFLVNSPAMVGQLVATTLKLWQGEWFLDTLYGTPWLQNILGVFGVKSVVDMLIQSVILAVPGVTSIVSYSSTLQGRALSITVTIDTAYSTTSTVGTVTTTNSIFTLDQSILGGPDVLG